MVSTGGATPTFTATYGVSADSSFSQESFAEEHGPEFALVSDMARDAIEGVRRRARYTRAETVRNHRTCRLRRRRGDVTYGWTADDPTTEPDYDALVEAVEAA